MKLKVIIIEDEVYARDLLAHYLESLSAFELVAQYDNCLTCFEHHDFDEIDLLLLDINLPTVSGIQFARTLSRYRVEIILTSAHSEYALEGYDLNVVDYLLKPIVLDRFKVAMRKAEERIMAKQPAVNGHNGATTPPDKSFIFIKADYKIMKVKLDQITFIEGMQEYVRIHLADRKPIVTLQSLKNLIAALPTDRFFRIHRSYIINLARLEYIQQGHIVVGGEKLRIGKNYGDAFAAYLKQHALY